MQQPGRETVKLRALRQRGCWPLAGSPGRQANLHRNYVGLLERGQRMPSILVVQQLAAALGTTMSDLLAEVEQESAIMISHLGGLCHDEVVVGSLAA